MGFWVADAQDQQESGRRFAGGTAHRQKQNWRDLLVCLRQKAFEGVTLTVSGIVHQGTGMNI